ncbi:MAG: DUF4255 domain-containing protein [Nitriliruptorales bacterium]|nr:DUF4255 domain-containing protein [Nitriliruptorales bacterium]
MISDVDEALRTLVSRDVLRGTKADIAFDAPNKDWAARRQGPALNLYLYDIREDITRRRVQFEERRNDEGHVDARGLPPRRFKLAYLVTAWTARPEDEHRLLSAVLACFLSSDALPPEVLPDVLTKVNEPLRVTVGLPLPNDRSISDVWSALGGELKPSLDLIVTIPVPALVARTQEVGPLVTEEPRIALVTPEGTSEKPQISRTARPSITELPVEAEEAVQGGKPDATSGRRVVIKSMPRP